MNANWEGEVDAICYCRGKNFQHRDQAYRFRDWQHKKSIEKQDDKFTRALEKLEKNLDAKFEKIDQRFEKIDQRFAKLEDKMDSNFKWLVGMYIPLTGVLLAAFYAYAVYAKN